MTVFVVFVGPRSDKGRAPEEDSAGDQRTQQPHDCLRQISGVRQKLLLTPLLTIEKVYGRWRIFLFPLFTYILSYFEFFLFIVTSSF